MSDVAIRVDGLSKQFRIGARERYRTLRDTLTDALSAPIRRLRRGPAGNPAETIWALKDVSFEVKHGEVIGIIGRNGAGKSTLLKILSRITEPTRGHAEIHGRVGSLLEVGTGFHPELTGRENVFLNGAILGMKKAEILRKFDEIVAFADIEKFIDTPVKHYSSGMYMRLAFSVAAHLEPEILLVDEVLAVGDAEFQKKCLGKMSDVAKVGRTVLFVSHAMSAINMLCQRAVLLEEGRLACSGEAGMVTQRYLAGVRTGACGRAEIEGRNDSDVRLAAIWVADEHGTHKTVFGSRDAVLVHMELEIQIARPDLVIGFDLRQIDGTVVFRSFHNDGAVSEWPRISTGHTTLNCRIPPGLLNGGTYLISPRIGHHWKEWLVHLDDVLSFDVLLNHSESPFLAHGHQHRPGTVAPVLGWGSVPRSHHAGPPSEVLDDLVKR